MANLSAVVQQLKKERANAQRVVGCLDAALKVRKGQPVSQLFSRRLAPAMQF
jgi:hypothetical protein